MKEEMAKIWLLVFMMMFLFACFFGRGWVIGMIIMIVIGFIISM